VIASSWFDVFLAFIVAKSVRPLVDCFIVGVIASAVVVILVVAEDVLLKVTDGLRYFGGFRI
jgi:hypothetical protein